MATADIIQSGTNVTVTGDGSEATPYVINATGGGAEIPIQNDAPVAPDINDLWIDADAECAGGGSTSTELLTIVHYSAGTDTLLGAAAASSSFADVDATNAAITFTVPSSGRVLIRVSAIWYKASTAGILNYSWNLREAAIDLSGTAQKMGAPASEYQTRGNFAAYIIGLTPGVLKTYKLGHARDLVTSPGVFSGPTNGPLIMEVWSAP